ncbi:aromatic prenyltransferase [Plantactinospora sp. KBS50]|uniref:aromatic prenyltransferase n=1 Tax=Plantactinospora sp. KBS50 TaxID=2024580 RepID=UPI000BAAF61E|nr:aromatic prenyltransferase [Plantactinospora sp. KBS50]ASW54821.1 prenyltransferase [Plantactinospora sp. KBS50]
MSETAQLAGLYSAIAESAQLLDVPCPHDTVWPILTAYGTSLAQSVIAFRVATGTRNAGDLDCRFMMLPKDVDPYDVAVSRGLLARTGHPSDALLSDLREHCPIDCYGIDFGVVGGFKKTWSFFPADDMQHLSTLAAIPTMPASLGRNLDFFARYGLEDKGSLIGIDHRARTMNVYFGTPPAECFTAASMRSMLRDLDLPAPSEQLVRLGEQAFGIYVTLSWDSPRVERICFAVMTPDPTALPVDLDPTIEHFIKNAPHDPEDRRFVYAITASPSGEDHKLQSYYQWRPKMLGVMLLADAADDLG